MQQWQLPGAGSLIFHNFNAGWSSSNCHHDKVEDRFEQAIVAARYPGCTRAASAAQVLSHKIFCASSLALMRTAAVETTSNYTRIAGMIPNPSTRVRW